MTREDADAMGYPPEATEFRAQGQTVHIVLGKTA